ncbi:pirin family protein [Luteimonas suaedae]|uniref:pirin family protein n=1 Tax=Luteimonas suaedae TaxID=2605430 RepID=UPI002106FFF6|nr:pirin family protein [Luteimonas suaedae]
MNLQTVSRMDQRREAAGTSADTPHRAIVHRNRGTTHGPITRLVSPGDLGEHIKPFVFLDYFKISATGAPRLAMHPHSGIATLTYLMKGRMRYEDSTGKEGVLLSGGAEWMRAGNGVWHTGEPIENVAGLGFQLWVALPASHENSPPQSMYLSPGDIAREGPVRVLAGRHGRTRGAIPAPGDMNYLVVELRDGERWQYTPPPSHDVAWLAVGAGTVDAGGLVDTGQLAIFEESNQAIDVVAHGDTVFVLGSAAKHPYDLITGYYSVHTSPEALAQGEAEIRRLGKELRRQGRL